MMPQGNRPSTICPASGLIAKGKYCNGDGGRLVSYHGPQGDHELVILGYD